jgi:hypothetical protein
MKWQDVKELIPIIGIPELILLVIALGLFVWLWRIRKASKTRISLREEKESQENYGGVNIFTTPAATSAMSANTSLADPPPPKPPHAQVDLSFIDRHTFNKTEDIVKRNEGSYVSGFIVTLERDPDDSDENRLQSVIIERSAVRWIGKQDFWDIMHPAPSKGYCASHSTAEQVGIYTNDLGSSQKDHSDALKHLQLPLPVDENQLTLDFGSHNYVKPIYIQSNMVLNDKVAQFMQHLEAHLINDIRATIDSIEAGRRFYIRQPEGLELIMGLIRNGYSEIHDLAITQHAPTQ